MSSMENSTTTISSCTQTSPELSSINDSKNKIEFADKSCQTNDNGDINAVAAAASQWRFIITDKYLTPYKFSIQHSTTMTVWDIKVRLQQTEHVEIEPRHQGLIYKGRLLYNDELLENVIVDMQPPTINMHLIEQSPFSDTYVSIFHDEMLLYLTGMGVNKDMATVALDVTDDDVFEALDFLQYI